MPMLIKNLSTLKFKIVALLYTLGLTFISLTPIHNVKIPTFKFEDKVVHFFMYFFLTIVWILAYPRVLKSKYVYLSLIILWGIFIEFLQSYMNIGRTGDPLDALANALGAGFGLFVFIKFLRTN